MSNDFGAEPVINEGFLLLMDKPSSSTFPASDAQLFLPAPTFLGTLGGKKGERREELAPSRLDL